MATLVAYASKHSATRQIAERIGEALRAAGSAAEVRPVREVSRVDAYDSFVIGSAVYFGSWLKDATAFAWEHQGFLTQRPVWLFSSGPIGNARVDAEGRDLREAAVPKEIPALREAIHARDHRVFFGALEPGRLGVAYQLLRVLPAARTALPAGDFRDWADVTAWAAQIARALTETAAARPL